MLLCIDDANVEAIRRLVEYYPIDGVSTNPTIISRTKREPFEVLKEIITEQKKLIKEYGNQNGRRHPLLLAMS